MSEQEAISRISGQAEQVRLAQIRLDDGTQSRLGGHDSSTIRRYAEEMQGGRWEFQRQPLPLLFFDGEYYYPGDGHHRILAAQMSGLTEFYCEVCPGDRRQAQFYSNTEANKYHGKQLTRKDKRHRVENLLLDAEWTLMSDREIARRCGVSAPFVGTVRKALVANEQILHSNKRRGKDGRVRDTTKIGRIKEESAVSSSDISLKAGASGAASGQAGATAQENLTLSDTYAAVLQERDVLAQRLTEQQQQYAAEIEQLTAKLQQSHQYELEQAIADDEALIQQLYDGLGTIREALDPDRPAQALREDVVKAARGLDLMRRILEAQAPNLVHDANETPS